MAWPLEAIAGYLVEAVCHKHFLLLAQGRATGGLSQLRQRRGKPAVEVVSC